MTQKGINVTSSASGKSWKLKPYQEKDALALSQHYNLPMVVASMLSARGHDLLTADAYLNPSLKKSMPDPLSLKDMDKAIERLLVAVRHGEKITIFGDYDVDGATSSAMIFKYLSALGISANVYIPDRIEEGYGPSEAAFKELYQKGSRVIVTVDCGTTAFAPLACAKELGLDVIVIDHHVAEPKLPEAIAIVNPNRLDEPSSPLQQLAAVGVSFMLLVGLNRALRQSGYFKTHPEPDIRQYLDLVALGTVCDVMPLQGLNRVFVKQGLKVLSKRNNIGLKALGDIGGIEGWPNTYHLGFILGPRINAGGRVGEASLGSQLLRTENPTQAESIAQKLDHYNRLRKEIEQTVLDEAMRMAEQQTSPVILVHGQDWHPGVIGIIAGRLKERFNRPAGVISFDSSGLGKGSARSIPGFDLGSVVQAAKQHELLEAGGGHTMAAGLTIKSDKLADFHDFLIQRFHKSLPEGYQPALELDGLINIRTLSPDFARKIDLLAPYGAGNPTPKFAISNLRIQHVDIVGQDHVKVIAGQMDGARLNAIAFRCVDTQVGQSLLNHKGFPLHLAGTIKLDSWMGQERVQFIIEDVAFAADSYALAG